MSRLSNRLRLVVGLSTALVLCGALPAFGQAARGARPAARRGGGGFGGFVRASMMPWNDNTGFTALFDGKDLNNWKGRSDVWSVQDGAITAETTPQKPTGTTNIWYTGGEFGNFILKYEVKMVGNGNGGIQFRSANEPPRPQPARRGGAPFRGRAGRRGPTPQQMAQMRALQKLNAPYSLVGYQLDMDTAARFDGQLYEQGTGRGIIAFPGDVIVTRKGEPKQKWATLATPAEIKAWIPDPQGWNDYMEIAQGHTLTQIVNGHVISILVDNDPTFYAAKGLIGMEIEGANMKIYYKDIMIKPLP